MTRHRRDREDLDYQFGIVRVAGVCWAGYWAAEPLWDVGLAWAPPMLGWPGLATWPGIVVMGSANNMPIALSPWTLRSQSQCLCFEHMTLSLWVWEWNCMRGVPSHVVCLWRLCGAGAIVMILEPWKLLYIKFRLLRPAPPLLLSTHIPGWGRTTSISTISCDCVHFISEGLVTSCKHLALISAGWRRIAWQGNSFLHKSGVLISKFRCARVCWNKKVGLQP